MADVFISYKREERAQVERIATALRGLKFDVWFDASLSAGEAFSDEIDREVHAAQAVLVCWSPAALTSQWVKNEASVGLERGVIICAHVAGEEPVRLPTEFRHLQTEDLRSWVNAPSHRDPAWLSVLRRLGQLTDRDDVAEWGALGAQASVSQVQGWFAAHGDSPLVLQAEGYLKELEAEAREREAAEATARERLARLQAEREAAEAERAKVQAERDAEAARAAAARRRAPWLAGAALGVVVLGSVGVNAAREAMADRARETRWRAAQAAPVVGDVEPQIAAAARGAPVDERMFKDCADCPVMVVVPAGSFTMGSPVSEEGRFDNEGPQQTVRIAQPFAVGRFEVTFDEWAVCVSGGGCRSRPNPSDRGWGRGRRPVINVDWNDARAYVRWLSQQTGETYRLLSEAEWEYAARAGTTTRFAVGDSISGSQARFRSGSTVEVGSYRPNAFGLYDMHGNVWEWTQDCWNDSYAGAPSDGRAWESEECSRRVLRGGSWNNAPQLLRSAARIRFTTDGRNSYVGFRLARTISP